MKDENELYAMVSDSIKAGGAGVSIGEMYLTEKIRWK